MSSPGSLLFVCLVFQIHSGLCEDSRCQRNPAKPRLISSNFLYTYGRDPKGTMACHQIKGCYDYNENLFRSQHACNRKCPKAPVCLKSVPKGDLTLQFWVFDEGECQLMEGCPPTRPGNHFRSEEDCVEACGRKGRRAEEDVEDEVRRYKEEIEERESEENDLEEQVAEQNGFRDTLEDEEESEENKVDEENLEDRKELRIRPGWKAINRGWKKSLEEDELDDRDEKMIEDELNGIRDSRTGALMNEDDVLNRRPKEMDTEELENDLEADMTRQKKISRT